MPITYDNNQFEYFAWVIKQRPFNIRDGGGGNVILKQNYSYSNFERKDNKVNVKQKHLQ